MKKIISSVQITDFRSFADKKIELSEVSCFVGANESGKTNLLKAIHLSKTDNNEMKLGDIRKNSPRHRQNPPQLPTLRYKVSSKIIGNSWLGLQLAEWKIEELELIRNGNSLIVELPVPPEDVVVLKNSAAEKIHISNRVSTASQPETTEIKLPKKDNKILEIELPPSGYKLIDESLYQQLQAEITATAEKGNVSVLSSEAFKAELEKACLKELNANLKVFFWSYDKKKYSLPDVITIKEIIEEINDRPVIKALFKLGGYSDSDIPTLLQGRSETDYDTFFESLSDTISTEIKKKWTSNPNLKIEIRHRGDHLTINFREPGHFIEPEFRSEGMRWFIAFIIGITAQDSELKDYVILIDEPALHLHPGGQRDALAEINRLAEHNQIIYSTHSPFMIDRRYPKRVIFLFKDVQDGYTITDHKLPEKKEIFKDPLLRAALLYSQSDISYLNEQNILVEGLFDKSIIEMANEWLTQQPESQFIPFDANLVSVIDCGGASRVASHAALCNANGLQAVSLYDGDTAGDNAQKANSQQKPDEKVSLKDIHEKQYTTEDLLPLSVIAEALKEWQVKNEKVNGNLNKPIMKGHIIPAIDLFQQPERDKSDANPEAIGNARIDLKHSFEDLLVKKFGEYLPGKTTEDSELTNLLKTITVLSDKTRGTQEKKQSAEVGKKK